MRPRLAILPLGATEQHSGHLPLCTDSLIAEHVALAASRELEAFCLPVLPYSISQMHRGCSGSIWLRNETLACVLTDIARSLAFDRIPALLILNGHGGNQLLSSVIQDLNMDIPTLFAFTLNAYDGFEEIGGFTPVSGLAHADAFETSVVMHLRPELAEIGAVVDNPDPIPSDALRYDPFLKVSPFLHTGKPTEATPEKGRVAFELMVNRVCTSARRILAHARQTRPEFQG